MNETIIYECNYCYESLVDIDFDIGNILNDPDIEYVKDNNHMILGTFNVKITYNPLDK